MHDGTLSITERAPDRNREIAPAFAESLHALRSPLVCLQGYTRLVLDERVGPLTALQKEYLSIVLESAQRMNTLLSEISCKWRRADSSGSLAASPDGNAPKSSEPVAILSDPRSSIK